MAKNLITRNTLNKKALAESSVLYILEDDLITPGAKDLIIQKKYKLKYVKKNELREMIKKIIKNEIQIDNLKEEKFSKIVDKIFKKII